MGNPSQPVVKLECPNVPASEQHTEIAQESYHHSQSLSGMAQSYSPIGYMQTEYGMMQPPEASNQSIMLTQHFTQIAEKPTTILPLGMPSPSMVTAAAAAPTVPELLHRDAIITTTQSHIQNQLQRKHEELQQLIMKQQKELQLVSEQLHLAQRGMLPVVSSTQTEPQFTNRHAIRTTTTTHQHQIEKIGNTSSSTRTVLRLTENPATIHQSGNDHEAYLEQPTINPTNICHSNEHIVNIPTTPASVKGNLSDQLPQVHSSQEFHNSKTHSTFDDQTIMSPATPASTSSTIGSIKFTSTSE